MAMIALIAFVGLTTDVALLYTAKAHLQRAVDAAALAAANKLPDKDEAKRAAYEFTRLHGYDFAPNGNPLEIDFPTSDPPRKMAFVAGTVDVTLAFLKIIGLEQAQVSAEGMGESAPLDVYLVLDLSLSMTYDTPRPWWWNSDWRRDLFCPPTGCPYCGYSDNSSWSYCQAYYCNFYRNCDPLDEQIKPAAQFFVDQLDPQYDRIGIISYDVEGSRVITLTDDFDAVRNAIDGLDAYREQEASTNIGDGLMYANHYISLPPPSEGGDGGRIDSVWSVILLTDGRANRYRKCKGCPPDCDAMPQCKIKTDSHAGSRATQWVVDNAWYSWDANRIAVYTIAYGRIFFDHPEYRDLMILVADITDNGTVDGDTLNFWVVPDEAGLRLALEEIAERIYTRLVR
jgi:hypothetical protein